MPAKMGGESRGSAIRGCEDSSMQRVNSRRLSSTEQSFEGALLVKSSGVSVAVAAFRTEPEPMGIGGDFAALCL